MIGAFRHCALLRVVLRTNVSMFIFVGALGFKRLSFGRFTRPYVVSDLGAGEGGFTVYILFLIGVIYSASINETKITKKHIARADSPKVRSVRFSSNFFFEVNNFFSFLSLETAFFFFSGV